MAKKKPVVEDRDIEALKLVAKGQTVSNTSARRLAKLGLVQFKDRKVYEGTQVRHVPDVRLNNIGRIFLESTKGWA